MTLARLACLPKIIEVVAPLGAGKTSLCRSLHTALSEAHINGCVSFENLEYLAPVLKRYADEPRAYAYPLQVAFYLEIWQRVITTYKASPSIKYIIVDSSIRLHHYGYSQLLYKKGYLSAAELKYLEKLLGQIVGDIGARVYGIRLATDCVQVQKNLAARGRATDTLLDGESIEMLLTAARNLECRWEVPFETTKDLAYWRSRAAEIENEFGK